MAGSGAGWVDLSMPLAEDIPRWKVRFDSVCGGPAHKLSTMTLPVHAGTHLDAPLHYVADGASVEASPLELAVSEARVIDLTHVEKNQCIGVEDIAPRFPAEHSETVLLRTDWHRRAYTRRPSGRMRPSSTRPPPSGWPRRRFG